MVGSLAEGAVASATEGVGSNSFRQRLVGAATSLKEGGKISD